jgi:hypothetical protein
MIVVIMQEEMVVVELVEKYYKWITIYKIFYKTS